jgi:hypothetical protein
MVNLSTDQTFSRWILTGLPLLTGIGIVGGFALRLGFGLPVSRVALPLMVLVAIQAAFFLGMYGIRKRYKQSQDLRAGVILTGVYCLLVGLVGMYYAGQLGLVGIKTFDQNYFGFSIYVVVVVGIGVAVLSVKKPTRLQ